MSTPYKNGLRAGVIFTIIIIFITLIGFTLTGPDLIGKLLGNTPESGEVTPLSNFVVFMALIGLWSGIMAAKPIGDDTWGNNITAGLFSGGFSGIVIAAFAYLIGILYANEVDVRAYLVSLSPETVTLFLYNQPPIAGALFHFGILIITNVLGSLFARGVLRGEWRKGTGASLNNLAEKTIKSPAAIDIIKSKYTRFVLLIILAAILIILPRQWGSYWNYVMGTVGIYILLGLGMNIIIGLSGQLVIGYVAFFAIGAYTFALLTSPEPHGILLNFWMAIVAGIIAAALAGILLGLPILGLRSDYLAIVTLGFGEIVRIMIKSDLLTPITAGPRGIRDVAGPTMFGKPFSSHIDFMYLIIVAVIVITFISRRLQNSRTGRAWFAIREDETVARATGINTMKSRLLALAIGAAFAGLAGALFASRNQFTGPEDHALMVSINVLCLVIVGGMGSLPGMFLGAFTLKGLPEILRELENYRMLMFGALLVVMMILRPEGLWPALRPRIEKYEELAEQNTPPDSNEQRI